MRYSTVPGIQGPFIFLPSYPHHESSSSQPGIMAYTLVIISSSWKGFSCVVIKDTLKSCKQSFKKKSYLLKINLSGSINVQIILRAICFWYTFISGSIMWLKKCSNFCLRLIQFERKLVFRYNQEKLQTDSVTSYAADI